MKSFIYKVFGLIIESEIELPELVPTMNNKPDVQIRIGKVPKHLPIVSKKGVLFEAGPSNFLIQIPSVCKYHAKNGTSITIQPDNFAEPGDVRLFLLGSTMGALILQRGLLPIHSSSVAIGNRALIISGNSASGKSSLAAGFLKHGYSIVSDDISVISINKEGLGFVSPGIPHLKLWRDILEHLYEKVDLDRIRPQLEKYRKPIMESFVTKSLPVQSLLTLSVKNSGGFSIQEIFGANKFNLLRLNTYRSHYVDGLGQTSIQFKLLSDFAKVVRVYKVERPSSPLLIDELVNFLERNIIQANYD